MPTLVDALIALDTARFKDLLLAPAHRQAAPHLGTVNYVTGWRTRARPGSFTPTGGILHHTAITGDGLDTCLHGRPDLAGPLVQVNTSRLGVINVIAAGRSNHAGACSSTALAEIRAGHAPSADARTRGLADDDGGNGVLTGIEMDFSGIPIGQPSQGGLHPESWGWQLVASIYTATVISYVMGWTGKNWAGHRCITGRKPDPAYGVGSPHGLDSIAWAQTQITAGVATLAATPAPPIPAPDANGVLPDTAASKGRAGLVYRDPNTGAIYKVVGVRAEYVNSTTEVSRLLGLGYGPQLDAEPELAQLLAANHDD